MSVSRIAFEQIKSITKDEMIRAVKRDGFVEDGKRGAIRIFINPVDKRRVDIHFHPHSTFTRKTLKGILADLMWTDDDLIRLKLIKRKPRSS